MRLRLMLLAVCVCVPFTAVAQVRYRSTETGPWRPWSFTAIASARQARGATAADVQAFQARLQALAAIVKSAPGVSPPIGFAGEMWGSLAGYDTSGPGQPSGRAVPLAGSLGFGAFPLIEFQRGGRLVNEDLKGGETETLQFVVNQLDGSIYGGSRPQGWGDAPLDAFVEPETGAAVAGLPRVGDVFVVRKNPKPLWLPFPLADALQPIVAERRTLYENRRDGYAKEVAEFARWRTSASRATRRAEWQKSAASMPKGAEFLATMEKSDEQIEAANEARLAPGGPEDKTVRAAERELQEVDEIIAALSPEDRRAPSCYDQRATRLADRFRAHADAPASCRPLVRPNWDYFDATLPRSAPQVVMIASFTRCLQREAATSTTRGGCVINRALVETMDWDAVRSWLDR
jgi:hypothetical protein